jgi:hypothetical protein
VTILFCAVQEVQLYFSSWLQVFSNLGWQAEAAEIHLGIGCLKRRIGWWPWGWERTNNTSIMAVYFRQCFGPQEVQAPIGEASFFAQDVVQSQVDRAGLRSWDIF